MLDTDRQVWTPGRGMGQGSGPQHRLFDPSVCAGEGCMVSIGLEISAGLLSCWNFQSQDGNLKIACDFKVGLKS